MALPFAPRRPQVKGGKTRTNQSIPVPVNIADVQLLSPSTNLRLIFDQPLADGGWGTGLLNFVQAVKTVVAVVGRPPNTTNQIDVTMSAAVTGGSTWSTPGGPDVKGLRLNPTASGTGIVA